MIIFQIIKEINIKVKINGYVGNRQLDWNKPSPTITGRGSRSGGAVIHPHPNGHRRLTVRECARIQSFPMIFILWEVMVPVILKLGMLFQFYVIFYC